MKWILVSILALMLASGAYAAPETRQIGPYTVSFNMNTPMTYQVQTQQIVPAPTGTIYPLVVATNNQTGAQIVIIEYNNLTDSTLTVGKSIAGLTMTLRGFNVTAAPADVTIDGKKGFLVTGVAMPQMGAAAGPMGAPTAGTTTGQVTLFDARYWLDSVDCTTCGPVSVGKTNVIVTSTYPQDVTQGILSSLHVTRSGAAAGVTTPGTMGTPTTATPSGMAAGSQAGYSAGTVTPPATTGQVMPPA